MDLIKVKKTHLDALIERLKQEGNWEESELEFYLDCPSKEENGVITFNPELEKDVYLREVADEFFYHKIPYVHFDGGQGVYDDYWEYYNPSVEAEPRTANYSNEHTDYIFKKWNLDELKELPAEQFKQAVISFFENPFKDYPKLEDLED